VGIWEAFSSLFNEGGWVLYPIFIVSVFTWFIALEKMMQYRSVHRARKKYLAFVGENIFINSTGNPLYDLLLNNLAQQKDPQRIERSLREFVSELSPKLNSGLSTMAACIVIAPLLGLLGTISGMNEMFSIIGEFGFGSPTIMASGISMALKASLTGLAVAVVTLFFLDKLKNNKSAILAAVTLDNRMVIQKARSVLEVNGNILRKEVPVHDNYHRIFENEEKPDINLAPFVDTIMILLIFFVVTANLYVETGINVTKPRAQSAIPSNQKAMLVGITREGTCHVYGRQVTLDKLRLLVEQETAKQQDLSVVIVADRETQTGKTVEVMDQCALGGAQKISIAAGKDQQ
jgi:biopolymer transport protein ExbD